LPAALAISIIIEQITVAVGTLEEIVLNARSGRPCPTDLTRNGGAGTPNTSAGMVTGTIPRPYLTHYSSAITDGLVTTSGSDEGERLIGAQPVRASTTVVVPSVASTGQTDLCLRTVLVIEGECAGFLQRCPRSGLLVTIR
jgi:hypothetical protein